MARPLALSPYDPPQQDQDQEQAQSHNQEQQHPKQQQSQPISLTLSRFSQDDCTASLVFCLKEVHRNQPTDPTTTASSSSINANQQQALAPWNSIYIPKHYRVPIPGQRQSSPGECDLVLKIFPRLSLPSQDSEPTTRPLDLVSPCDKCKTKKWDIFQIEGPDPAVPSPQRLLTFELHHGKRVLMSETVKNAGPGMVPEPILLDQSIANLSSSRTPKRKPSDELETVSASMPRNKRTTTMSLANLITDVAASLPSSPSPQTEGAFTPATSALEPSSPTAVVPLSPKSFERENNPDSIKDGNGPRKNSPSNDDHTPASWSYDNGEKGSRSGSERAEENNQNPTPITTSFSLIAPLPKHATKKRQEPPELSELGIGQRASANLHAAYVSSQLKERSKTNGGVLPAAVEPNPAKTKNGVVKVKPSHTCPEPDCEKSFSRLFNLRSHMRTHSKARPFVCQSCNFAFSRRHDRDRHAKKHLSEKPYKCIVCEATFVRQDALVRHLRMDGVQNTCMAAMEQRAVQLGENGNGYMLAATQQAHDEQEREDRRDADQRQQAAQTAQTASSRAPSPTTETARAVLKNEPAEPVRKREVLSEAERQKIIEGQKALEQLAAQQQQQQEEKQQQQQHRTPRSLTPPKASMESAESTIDTKAGAHVKEEPSSSSAPDRFVDRSNDQGSNDGPAEDYPGTMAYSSGSSQSRSFYPSPSLSHSRSHSQSQMSLHPEYAQPHQQHQTHQHYYHYPHPHQQSFQPPHHTSSHSYPHSHSDHGPHQHYHHYPPSSHGGHYDMGPGYPSHPHSAAPPPHVYLGPGSAPKPFPPGSHHYGGHPPHYGYPPEHRYYDRSHDHPAHSAVHESNGEDGYRSYGSREGGRHEKHRQPEEVPVEHGKAWTGEGDEEPVPDKGIYDAAMGLLNIRGAQW
ncbi:hypothetical protein BGZ83_008318 [Gryganskiella cystojenkinii]|nr:hypothetical protein BGZ83_008318 [Gryganskiella cystojenkinii]